MSEISNIEKYDLWSEFYDEYENPTVAIDDMTFPLDYSYLRDKKVLEIGCGTGRHTLRLHHNGNRVTAIDTSEGMISKARQKIKASVNFIVGNYIDYEIVTGPFDAIVMSLVLEHIEDLNHFFEKSSRMLAEEGFFHISEIHPERSRKNHFANFRSKKGDKVYLNGYAHTEQNIRTAAENAGFKILECKTIHGNTELTRINNEWEKYLNAPMIQIWKMRLSSC